MVAALRAGVGRVELAPELGIPMMGYGARQSTATGRHDPLFARALYCEAESDVLLIEADVCLMAVSQAADIRARIAERTGLSPERIMVGCIHTHSGPETGLLPTLTGRPLPSYAAPILDACVDAGVRAHASAAPARLGVATADVCIGRNRRRADAAIDATTPVVRVDGEDGSALAVLYVHACHPTALGHDNLLFSADWPGAAARTIEDAIPGALAIFALGAHADVDPRTRGLLDLAVANQSVGVSFEEMEALGREVGEAVAEVASAIVTRADVEVAAAVRTIDASVHGGDLAEDAYDAWLAVRRGEALSALGLDPDENVRTADFYRLERDAIQGLPPDAVRERLGRVRSYLRDRTATRIAQGRRTGIELQLVRLGPLLLLGLPLEVTVDVGLAWRRRAPAEFTAIVSIANGWLRYLPDPRHFEEPEALHQYEILQSTFVPDTAERLLDAAEQLAGTV